MPVVILRSCNLTIISIVIGNSVEDDGLDSKLLRFFENKDWDAFFFKILHQLGFKKAGVKLRARFKNHRLEFYYEVLVDNSVSFGNKEVLFQKGDQVIVAVPYHYSKNDFRGFLNLYFDEVEIEFSESGSYALAFCKK